MSHWREKRKGQHVGTKPCPGSPEIGWSQSSRAGYFEIVANSMSDSVKKVNIVAYSKRPKFTVVCCGLFMKRPLRVWSAMCVLR